MVLVHDGCVWLGTRIPIDDIMIIRIVVLPYQGVNIVDAFVEKYQEKKLAEMMKKEYNLIRKSRGFLINSINDLAMCFFTNIFPRKIMRKC